MPTMVIDIEKCPDSVEPQNPPSSNSCASTKFKERHGSPEPKDSSRFTESFRKHWPNVTEDNYFTLYGFRRFRTTHLINLRFLEEEIARVDHQIFQAGLSLGHSHTVDKLGLKHGKRDQNPPIMSELFNGELVLRLRDLIKQYGM